MRFGAIGGLGLGLSQCLALSVLAASPPVPSADSQGDYYSNVGPVLGVAEPPLSPGSLWQVVSDGINCRRQPGQSHAMVRQYRRGAVLQAEVYRGGSDEVNLNPKDSQGKPWMAVRGKDSSHTCYVRANRRYIRPLSGR